MFQQIFQFLFLPLPTKTIVRRDSTVGIATRYGLDGPGIESRWGARFSTSVQTGPGVHPASYTMGTEHSPGVKRPGRGFCHPPLSSAEVKERVELYLYSTFGPSWPAIGRPLPLSFIFTIGMCVGTEVAHWLRCCATKRKIAGSIAASVNGFFIEIKSFRSIQPLTEISTRSISWG